MRTDTRMIIVVALWAIAASGCVAGRDPQGSGDMAGTAGDGPPAWQGPSADGGLATSGDGKIASPASDASTGAALDADATGGGADATGGGVDAGGAGPDAGVVSADTGPACTPKCSGKLCGTDDGCRGTCTTGCLPCKTSIWLGGTWAGPVPSASPGTDVDIIWTSEHTTSCSVTHIRPDQTTVPQWATSLNGQKSAAPTMSGLHSWSISCQGPMGSCESKTTLYIF